MLEFLKRKKKEIFVPRIFRFYGEDAELLWRLWDEYVKVDTKEARYNLWAAIDKRVSDTDIADDGDWNIKLGNALVFKIVEEER